MAGRSRLVAINRTYAARVGGAGSSLEDIPTDFTHGLDATLLGACRNSS